MLIRCIPEFLLGIISYRLFSIGWAHDVLRRDGSLLLVIAAIIALSELPLTDAAIIGAFPLLILSAAYNDAGVSQFLALKPLQYFGRISYSIYMVQIVPIMWLIFLRPWVNALGWPASAAVIVFACVPTIWLGAAMSYCVEYPVRGFLRGLSAGSTQRA